MNMTTRRQEFLQSLISGLECFAILVSDGSICCSTLLPYLHLGCQYGGNMVFVTCVLVHLFRSSPAPPASCCDQLPTFAFHGVFLCLFFFSYHLMAAGCAVITFFKQAHQAG